MADNQTIRFAGEGDQEPGIEPGDIVIALDEQQHERFSRRKMDLIYSMNISLSESLTGFSRTIKTLDARVLLVESNPGEIIKPDEFRCIPNEGMPRFKSPFQRGRLIIKFNVEFPSSLEKGLCHKLRQILPRNPDEEIPEDHETCTLASFDPQRDFHQSANDSRGVYAEDEDDDGSNHGPQRVQCGSQ